MGLLSYSAHCYYFVSLVKWNTHKCWLVLFVSLIHNWKVIFFPPCKAQLNKPIFECTDVGVREMVPCSGCWDPGHRAAIGSITHGCPGHPGCIIFRHILFTLVCAQTHLQCISQHWKITLLLLFFRSFSPVQEQVKFCSDSNKSGSNFLLS